MKKLFQLIIFFICSFYFSQDGILFQEGSLQDLLEKAKKEKKLVFIDAYASWCGPCKLMEKNIFPLKPVGELYNKNFISARFDMEKGEGRDIASKYSVRSYPTYLFLNSNGDLIMKNMGYMEEQDFLTIGKEAGNPENLKYTPEERFAKGEKDPDFLISIMQQNAQSNYELAKKASERYFQNKKSADFSKDDIGLLLYFIKTTEDPNYKIFTDSKAEIIKFLPEDIYKQFDANIKLSKILENALDEQNKLIKDEYFYTNAIPLVGKEEATKALNRLKINFYPEVGNYKEYEKAAVEYFKTPDNFDTTETLKAAWIFSEHITNPESLKKAEEWAEKSVMQSETPENTYILAKLYFKNGKKENAKMYAEISQHLAKSANKDASLAEKLLKEIN